MHVLYGLTGLVEGLGHLVTRQRSLAPPDNINQLSTCTVNIDLNTTDNHIFYGKNIWEKS